MHLHLPSGYAHTRAPAPARSSQAPLAFANDAGHPASAAQTRAAHSKTSAEAEDASRARFIQDLSPRDRTTSGGDCLETSSQELMAFSDQTEIRMVSKARLGSFGFCQGACRLGLGRRFASVTREQRSGGVILEALNWEWTSSLRVFSQESAHLFEETHELLLRDEQREVEGRFGSDVRSSTFGLDGCSIGLRRSHRVTQAFVALRALVLGLSDLYVVGILRQKPLEQLQRRRHEIVLAGLPEVERLNAKVLRATGGTRAPKPGFEVRPVVR